jgi:glycosyltransferase involved in cell wall biosynthesis
MERPPIPLTISLAAPAFNEAENIGELVGGWASYLRARFPADDFEIVICDDGSLDATGKILDELSTREPSLRCVHHPVNQGAAAALATAIHATTKNWILLLDSDGQYPVENLDLFLSELKRSGGSAYTGCRVFKADSAFARFGSWLSGALCNAFHGTHYRDFNCALKFVQGTLLRRLCLEARGLNYSTEISSKILESGVKMTEIQIIHQPRTHGRSHRTLLRGSLHRLLFVSYVGMRQLLLRLGVLRRPTP